jgi:hypothetical protein
MDYVRLLSAAGKRGFLLDRYNSNEEISSTLNLLRPMESGHELIRVGSDHDGGYLVPNVLEGIVACFSPGVSDNSAFEFQLAEMGITCFLADNSVEGPSQDHKNFRFLKKHLDSQNSESTITLEDWLNLNTVKGDLILQMDIEGFEYPTICSTKKELLEKFRVIVIELHEFDSLVTKLGNIIIRNLLNKLTENHQVIHVHPNNYGAPRQVYSKKIPRCLEITLLRNDFFVGSGFAPLHNPLDQPNIPEYPEIRLNESWFN